MKKNVIFLIVSILILFSSCSEESSNPSSIIDNHSDNPRNVPAMTGPTQTFYSDSPLAPAHCDAPKKDCYPEIVVTGEKITEDLILTDHINNNTVYLYFQESNQEHYEILFPNFSGPALYDLRSNITTLRKLINKDGTVNYYTVFTDDTTSSPDYSEFY